MLTIQGKPDCKKIDNKTNIYFAGRNWSDSIRNDLNQILQNPSRITCLDMANIDFISMFEWVSFLATIDKILLSPQSNSFVLNFLAAPPTHSIAPNKYIGLLKKEQQYQNTSISVEEFRDIDRLYKLTGFLESLRTLKIMNRLDVGEKLEYQWITPQAAQTRAFYSSKGSGKKQTTLLSLTHIASKNHCKSFLDNQQIHSWREAMEDRFRRSPLLRVDEVWRVIFHELAVNIWEHSGTSGFISSRVVAPYKNNNIKNIWKCIFPDITDDCWPIFKRGLLEICVADAGKGIVNTLKPSFVHNISVKEAASIRDHEILSFSLDELGTCKSKEHSWVTDRHALGRTLSIISKYGGSLTIRSGKAEICYITKGGLFEHLPFHQGYKPTYIRELPVEVKGTQIQILLPLFPQINVPTDKEQKSVLEISLPNAFTTDSSHPQGHLVPLREALFMGKTSVIASIGANETLKFKNKCERVALQLIKSYADTDIIVFDFSEIRWTAAQFETFVFCFQNIIQKRPTLMVELNSQLAAEIKTLEYNNTNTTLNSVLVNPKKEGSSDKVYGELAEKKYSETLQSTNATLLALDEKGIPHMFALPSSTCEKLLIQLIKKPYTINELCYGQRHKHKITKLELESILHNINPLFQIDQKSRWSCIWDENKISIQTKRAMSHHFDEIADISGAWIGKSNKKEDPTASEGQLRFNLSWQKEWRDDFLESSKILSRERYADEAAQRLIFRLQKGLAHLNQSLKNIHVLACPTGPAMLLATAIHKWWPEAKKPIVADMSYYALLGDSEQLPMLLEGEVIIVQDILDQGTISGNLIKAFQDLKINVVCVIGLIRLVKKQGTRVTQILEGWKVSTKENESRGVKAVPMHAMIETNGPPTCNPPVKNEDYETAYWIEPRALYPIKYPYLRREFVPGRDADLDRRNKFLPQYFDSSTTGCLFASGHYVYGQRHYAVAVNVRKTLSGQLGDEIATWLADVCLGNQTRQDVPWESQQGKSLVGSVTAVLMPLHSQIHYLWPKVANILAQFGRRQPVWLLDATLFTGSGVAYRLPAQFISQIQSVVKKMIDTKKNTGGKNENVSLRLLILDDAVTTGRTAETILGAITREVEKSYSLYNTSKQTLLNNGRLPIEWIRYFSIFSQLGYARHLLWKNMTYIDGINFVVEEFAPFMGVPVFDEKNCPICRDRRRLQRLVAKCKRLGALHTSNWALACLQKTFPIAIDSPWGQGKEPEQIEAGINMLGGDCDDSEFSACSIPKHTDTAIWRFYEYMYLSYPIGDFLFEINKSWESAVPFPQMYRWTVLEWCLRNWPRVKASTARSEFLNCALKELENNTDLLERILEASTQHFSDATIKLFVKKCIIRFAAADKVYLSGQPKQSTIKYLKRLEIGLHAFFLHIPKIELGDTYSPEHDTELIDVVKIELKKINSIGPTFFKNLYARLIRPRRVAKPDWSLNVIAETLLRGRNPANNTEDGHHLLPGLIDRVLTSWRKMDWMLLQGSITLFKAALTDLSPYTTIDPSFGDKEGGKVEQLCEEIIKWYEEYTNIDDAETNSPRELETLHDILGVNENFLKKVHGLFHPEMNEIKSFLEDRKEEKDNNNLLDFSYIVNKNTEQCRCLVLSNHLKMCLANISIDHIKNCTKHHKSRIICSRNENDSERIFFRILTNFTDHKEATSNLNTSRHFTGERNILSSFGVVFDNEWAPTSGKELEEGFIASFKLSTPSGYLPRSI